MTDSPIRIAVLLGSTSADSINRQIAETLRDQVGPQIELDLIDNLASLPFYDAELDATDTPASAVEIRGRVARADAVLAITPEYNGTMPAVLNNAIDWFSRPYGAGAMVGKRFGVIGATPTPYGGKWAHDDAQRSAGVAGATVVEAARHSQSALEVDVLTDPEVLDRFHSVIQVLADSDHA